MTLQQRIHEIAKSKGFWDHSPNVGQLVMLIVSELGEALEAHRKGRFSQRYLNINVLPFALDHPEYPKWFEKNVKDTFEDELADAYIRILDMAEGFKITATKGEIEYKNVDMDNVGDRLLDITAGLVYLRPLFPWAASCPSLLAGVLYKLFHLSREFNFDIEMHIEMKLAYNQTRARLHGKKY